MVRSLIANFLNLIAGGTGLFAPQGQYKCNNPASVTILTPGLIPTTDIYLSQRMSNQFGNNVHYVNTLQTQPDEIVLAKDSIIFIVRYSPPRWLRWLKSQQSQISKVIFLMDDDIPSILEASELPFLYAVKTAWRYALTRRLLSCICSEIHVSTIELSQRYSASTTRLSEPQYVEAPLYKTPPITYFYHGTWAHRKEIEWLVPVVRQVQSTFPNAWFEIMGTDRVKRLFKGIPRVKVIHPMPWRDYLAYANLVHYQVGLAPCFDTSFNRARSHNKIFDITRLGAAGIYSDLKPYTGKIIHGQTGLLCINDHKKWVEALLMLLHNQNKRSFIYTNAKSFCTNNCFSDKKLK